MVVPPTMSIRFKRLRCGLRYEASMLISLVIDTALFAIVPVVGLFSPNNLNFSGRHHWVCFLLLINS